MRDPNLPTAPRPQFGPSSTSPSSPPGPQSDPADAARREAALGAMSEAISPGIDRPENAAKYTCILYKLWDYYKDHTPNGISAIDYWASPFPYSFAVEMERLGYAYREGDTIWLLKDPCWLSISRRKSTAANYVGASFDSPYFRDLPYRRKDWV